jgi:hypothetical protein
LQRKLHHWELLHLRQVVADQQTQLDAQAAEIAQLQRDLSWAEDCAESWRDDALSAIEQAGCTPGLTQSGHVLAFAAQGYRAMNSAAALLEARLAAHFPPSRRLACAAPQRFQVTLQRPDGSTDTGHRTGGIAAAHAQEAHDQGGLGSVVRVVPLPDHMAAA